LGDREILPLVVNLGITLIGPEVTDCS